MLLEQELYHDFEIKKQQLNQKLVDLNNQILQKQESIDTQIENLDNDLVEYRNSIQQERNKIIKEHQEKVIDEDRNYTERLKEIENNYKIKVQDLQQELQDFKNNVEDQKKTVLEELQKYQDKQNELIQQFKEQEEIKQKEDFYRIQLSSKDIEDIKKLREVADSLNSPSVLYKLIWENYYRTPFSSMCGRIIDKEKKPIGIYKITNRVNGKSYIGQTRDSFNNRWRSHVRKGLKAEASSMNKFYSEMWEIGPEEFTFEVLSYCSADELNEKEKYYIEFFKSNEWGYNSTGGNK